MVTTTVQRTYTPEQAENDVASLRGQVDALNEFQQIGTIEGPTTLTGGLTVDTLDVTGAITATGGTVSSPTLIHTDSWHAGSLSNSWTTTSGFFQYRLTIENELQISASINGPSSSTVNGVTIITFPSGYQPLSTHTFPVATNLLPSSFTSIPRMSITSAGVMQATGVGGNPGSAFVNFEVRIPLDI